MSASRRYEILLPLRFNDGQAVPDALIADTLLELEITQPAALRRVRRTIGAEKPSHRRLLRDG